MVDMLKRLRETWGPRDYEVTDLCKEAVAVIEAAQMARKRLEDFADQANAGKVHHDARELKRKIWSAFAEFDALV